jgi:hypothetical protein
MKEIAVKKWWAYGNCMIIFNLNNYNFYLNQNKNISSKLIDDYFRFRQILH